MVDWIAGNWPDGFKCLVSHDGVFDQRAMAYETEELWFNEWEFGGPYYEPAAAAIYERSNPVNFVQNWRTPMLLIHGERDFRIPYSQSLGAFNALQRRDIPSRLHRLPRRESLGAEAATTRSNGIARSIAGSISGCPPKRESAPAPRAGSAFAAVRERNSVKRPAMTELPKTFDPAEIEARWYARWEGEGLFRPTRPEAEPWTIVMPPPNVTGSLHIGHALDITLQDILTRHARLQGKDALWVVGTDHAGIATQMVVERQLERAPAEAHRFHPRGVRRQGLGMEGGERRRDHPPAPPARRLAATGRTSASPWTRASRRRCSRCSSTSTARACSIATSGW